MAKKRHPPHANFISQPNQIIAEFGGKNSTSGNTDWLHLVFLASVMHA